jgi:hypothetical protein
VTPLICPSCGAQTPRLAGASSVTCMKCRAPIPTESLAPPTGEAGAEAPGAPVYHVERFQPTRGGSPAGVLVAVGFGLVAALVLGALAAFVRQYFWAVLIFALLLGAGIGIVTSLGARVAKCRRTELAVGAGIITGLAGAFVLHYVAYLLFLANLNLPLGPAAGGLGGFGSHLELKCRLGVMSFGYVGSIIYYAVEAAVIAGTSGACAVVLLKSPFCEPCGVWKQKETLGTFQINTAVAAAAVASGQPALMVAPSEGDEAVALDIYRCPNCRNNAPIEVRASCTKGKGENAATVVVFVTYPGEATADFQEVRRQCISS